MKDTWEARGYVRTANFELDTMIACEEYTPTPAEEARYMTIQGKRAYIKKDQEAFLELANAYGIREGRVFKTEYGPLEIRGLDGEGSSMAIYTRFRQPERLPKGTSCIWANTFNPYSGKWNFHFSFEYGWHPAGALCEFMKALDSIRIKGEAVS
jgi:hypothetical protein